MCVQSKFLLGDRGGGWGGGNSERCLKWDGWGGVIKESQLKLLKGGGGK